MVGSLPFLDLKIHRHNRLLYSVYREETNYLSYINFISAYHDDIKKSMIPVQFLRSYRLCDEILLNQEVLWK